MRLKSFFVPFLMSLGLFTQAEQKFKRFECRVNTAQDLGRHDKRLIKMNVDGIIHEKSKENNLYLLHNVSGNIVWDLFGESPEDSIDLSYRYFHGYMNPQTLLENKVDYKPRKYKGTVKYELPLGFGDFQFMMPKFAMNPGVTQFKSYLVASWVQDHDGGSTTLDCISHPSFTALSDQYVNLTNDKSYGEEGLKIRNEFRVGKSDTFGRKLLENSTESTWSCDYIGRKRNKIVTLRNKELKITSALESRFKENTFSGLFNGKVLHHRQATLKKVKTPSSRSATITVKRTLVKNGEFQLLLEESVKPLSHDSGDAGAISNPIAPYALSNMEEVAVGYGKCTLKNKI